MNAPARPPVPALTPLVAILRGLTPDEAIPIGEALFEAGISTFEVPLNSPQPLLSIERLAKHFAGRALVGAGTVLTEQAARDTVAAGGQVVVMPHADTAVIRAAKACGVLCLPGVATPTEAFAALAAGADGLKLFPAEQIAPDVVKALLAVLPPGTKLFPVGGITPERLQVYLQAGVAGFGIGGALYRPGRSATDVKAAAERFVAAWAACL